MSTAMWWYFTTAESSNTRTLSIKGDHGGVDGHDLWRGGKGQITSVDGTKPGRVRVSGMGRDTTTSYENVPRRTGSTPRHRGGWQTRLEQLVDTALHSGDPEERKYALSELPLLESKSIIRFTCLAALNDADADVRLHAVLALDDLQDLAVYPHLERLGLTDPNPEVREAALDVMDSLRIVRPRNWQERVSQVLARMATQQAP